MFRSFCSLWKFSSTKNVTLVNDSVRKTSTITLSNASKRNTLSFQTLKGISDSLKSINQQIEKKHIRSLWIKSTGNVFSSGHDLKEIADPIKAKPIFELLAQIICQFKSLPIPVISVVNGLAAAGGCQLMASTDLVIATEKSTFSTPGVKWGLFCNTPGVALIRSMTSEKKALEMLFLGQPISAQQAYTFGLITKVVKQAELEAEETKYIEAFNKLSGEVIALGKKAYNEQKNKSLEEAYKITVCAMVDNIKTADGKEGLQAFADKRHPHFHN